MSSASRALGGSTKAEVARKKGFIAWLLIWASSCYFVGAFLGNAAEQEIWLQYYKGDFGANAMTQGMIQSVSGLTSMALQQLVANFTDAYGRRPVILFAQASSLIRCLSMLLAPNVLTVVVGDLARAFTLSTWFISVQAALGDLFKSEPQRHSKFNAFFMMLPPATGIICPLLGSCSAARTCGSRSGSAPSSTS